jgi:hypothetical protein
MPYTLKKKAESSYETVVTICHTPRPHIPQDRDFSSFLRNFYNSLLQLQSSTNKLGKLSQGSEAYMKLSPVIYI